MIEAVAMEFAWLGRVVNKQQVRIITIIENRTDMVNWYKIAIDCYYLNYQLSSHSLTKVSLLAY